MRTFLCCLAFTFLIACVGRDLEAGDAPPPKGLTPDNFEAIKARVNVTPGDLAWQKVRWRSGFFEGLMEAQAEDKPLFFWFYGGDPTGNC